MDHRPPSSPAEPERPAPPEIDTTVPHSARIWNYWLGGKDNYPVDRQAGDEFTEIFPGIVDAARAVRHFLARAVRHLAEDVGIRQFLDIGTGLPTVDNTHEIAQRVAPEARIVYVDNDPLVLAHARALLTSTAEGATDYIDADVRDPDRILEAAAETLDFGRPVGLMLMGIMGHLDDRDDPHAIVRRLLDALPSGSHLVLNDGTDADPKRREAHQRYNRGGAVPYHLRSPEEITRFFDGLELLEPGVVPVSQWRPEHSPFGIPPRVETLGGVGRKP
ncbi:SAM-dependent methyltransferase [Actinoallomurus rhizosphaericola]|uniref:SAM-dependent methyltransferase n=1 Tax=Actinoallomurus rhizosphaericola TaxID=2952536 RepID=UPI002093544B|nr:SAM-dependent methyltransferase [Actinoallomurus rhizosphaericola]MCO5996224.1 SAM-dependent methyltransferase [Actinoallomurus rhizosphaericola]